MNPVWTLEKKRDAAELSDAEIGHFIAGYAAGDIPDYQMSALAMAIFLQGMTPAETASLTEHMLASGVTFKWPNDGLPKVDKHSTGGIGDKVSLVLAPMLACCGLQVPMISGRGLGATGGTLDKLESIFGFRTDLTMGEIVQVVDKVGCVITGATADLVPADHKLYALRDVTATVPSIPLITASIMSKKLAEGLDALVLDVKFGSGAFMKTLESARELAQSLVETGNRMGVKTTALLTDMNQPLGRMVGNAVEVDEAVAALEGSGPADLMEVTLALGTELLLSVSSDSKNPPPSQRGDRGGFVAAANLARKQLQETINSGKAREKFAEMVAAQGGNLDIPRPVAPKSEILATQSGYVASIDAEQLGQAVIAMHGGRRQLGDKLDHSTGFEMQVRLGDHVDVGQPLAFVYVPKECSNEGKAKVAKAIHLDEEFPTVGDLVMNCTVDI